MDFHLAIGAWGLETSQGVMLSIGAVEGQATYCMYLPREESSFIAIRNWPGTDDAVRLRARGSCLA